MNEQERQKVYDVAFGYSEQTKDRIILGKNTEAGFTGHLVKFRNPPEKGGQVEELELWVAKELPKLQVAIKDGGLEPQIDQNATYLGTEAIRFKNLLHIICDEMMEQLSTGVMTPGEALQFLFKPRGEDG